MDHAAAFYGCIMVVHGGYHTEKMEYLSDFGFYDILERDWIPVELAYESSEAQ